MSEQKIESWRHVWRKAVAPLLSTEGLLALKGALERDDPRLIQGATTTPPPLMCVQDRNCEAACLLGYCGWQGDGLETVGEVEEFFSRVAHQIDMTLGEPGGCRYFLNWYDEEQREHVFRDMLSEVNRELQIRCGCEATTTEEPSGYQMGSA